MNRRHCKVFWYLNVVLLVAKIFDIKDIAVKIQFLFHSETIAETYILIKLFLSLKYGPMKNSLTPTPANDNFFCQSVDVIISQN